METRELRITKSVTFIKGELHTTEPKAKSPIRVIVPPGSLLEILKNYKATVKVDHQIGKTDAPMPSDEQKQHTDQSGFQPYKSKYRKAGTGGIYQLSDHLWEGKYSPRDANGKRISRKVYAKNREECEEKLAAMIEKMKREIAAEKEQMKI